MRTLGLSALLLGACMTTPEPSTSGSDGSGSTTEGSCAPDPTVSEGWVQLEDEEGGPIDNGTVSVWTGQKFQVESAWSDVCSHIVACPLGVGTSEDTPVYASCAHQKSTTTVTATGAANTIADGEITTLAAGTLAVHMTTTNLTNNQTLAGDVTLVVHDLEAIRIRCFVDPFGARTPCPDAVPAGTQIGFVVDGLTEGHYEGVLGDVTLQGGPDVYLDETGVQMPGDDGYVALWYLSDGIDQTTTMTVSEVGVTGSLTVTVQ